MKPRKTKIFLQFNKIFIRTLVLQSFLLSGSVRNTNINKAIEYISTDSLSSKLKGLELLNEEYSRTTVEAKEHKRVVKKIEYFINNETSTIRYEAIKLYLTHVLYANNSEIESNLLKLLNDNDLEIKKLTLSYILMNISSERHPNIYREVELIYENKRNDKGLRMNAVMTLFGQHNVEYIKHYAEKEEDLEIRNMLTEQLSYRMGAKLSVSKEMTTPEEIIDFEFIDASSTKYQVTKFISQLEKKFKHKYKNMEIILLETPNFENPLFTEQLKILRTLDAEELGYIIVISCISQEEKSGYYTTLQTAKIINNLTNSFRITILNTNRQIIHKSLTVLGAKQLTKFLIP